MKKIKRFLVLILCLMMLLPVIAMRAAAADLDEILNYTITVDAAQAERNGQKPLPEGTSFSTDEFFEAALLRSYGNPQDGGEA